MTWRDGGWPLSIYGSTTMFMYVCTYVITYVCYIHHNIYIYICTLCEYYMYIYIYIYRERERDTCTCILHRQICPRVRCMGARGPAAGILRLATPRSARARLPACADACACRRDPKGGSHPISLLRLSLY